MSSGKVLPWRAAIWQKIPSCSTIMRLAGEAGVKLTPGATFPKGEDPHDPEYLADHSRLRLVQLSMEVFFAYVELVWQRKLQRQHLIHGFRDTFKKFTRGGTAEGAQLFRARYQYLPASAGRNKAQPVPRLGAATQAVTRNNAFDVANISKWQLDARNRLAQMLGYTNRGGPRNDCPTRPDRRAIRRPRPRTPDVLLRVRPDTDVPARRSSAKTSAVRCGLYPIGGLNIRGASWLGRRSESAN